VTYKRTVHKYAIHVRRPPGCDNHGLTVTGTCQPSVPFAYRTTADQKGPCTERSGSVTDGYTAALIAAAAAAATAAGTADGRAE